MDEQKKLPKNIRQVGQKDERFQIYLEDYVHTYLDRFCQIEENTFGVLLGTSTVIDGNAYLFIRGAMEVRISYEENKRTILPAAKTVFLNRKEELFPDEEICGLFVFSTKTVAQALEEDFLLLKNTFPESKPLIFYLDGQEKQFYYAFEGQPFLIQGFTIYYDKNEGMQNFLIEKNQKTTVEKREVVVDDFRERMKNKKKKVMYQGLRIANYACGGLLILVLFMGLGLAVLKDRLENLEKRMENTEVFVDATIMDTIKESAKKASVIFVSKEETISSSKEETTEESTNAFPKFHIVKKGETLSSISKMYYGDSKHVADICALNSLSNPNSIVTGQVLWLPEK